MLANNPASWETFFNKFYWLFVRGAPSKKKCKKMFLKLGFSTDWTILEVGCGTGFFLRWFKKIGFKNVTGLDYAPSLLIKLKEAGIKTIQGDMQSIQLDSRLFDVVFSDGVVEHYVDPMPLLQKCANVAKRYLITIVPRKTLVNRIETWIMRPPTEHNRLDKDWVLLHQKLGFDRVDGFVLGQNCLMVVCVRTDGSN